MPSHRLLRITSVGLVVVIASALLTVRALLDQEPASSEEDIAWNRSAPADLELQGRPQLVEFFHPQ